MQRYDGPPNLNLPEVRYVLNNSFGGLSFGPQQVYVQKNKLIIQPNDNMRIKIDLDLARKEYASALYKSIERTLYHPDAVTVLTIFEDENEKLQLPVFGLDSSNMPKGDITLLEKLDGDLKSVARTPGYVLVFKAKGGKIDYKNYGVVHVGDLKEYYQLREVETLDKLDGVLLRERFLESRKREFRINVADDTPVEDDSDEDFDRYGYGSGYLVMPKESW